MTASRSATATALASEPATTATRCDKCEDILRELAARADDALSALRYIEQRYGRLDGVGWDRLIQK